MGRGNICNSLPFKQMTLEHDLYSFSYLFIKIPLSRHYTQLLKYYRAFWTNLRLFMTPVQASNVSKKQVNVNTFFRSRDERFQFESVSVIKLQMALTTSIQLRN